MTNIVSMPDKSRHSDGMGGTVEDVLALVQAEAAALGDAHALKFNEAFHQSYGAMECARVAREMRMTAHMTQRQVALAVGVTQQRIATIESGRSRNGITYAVMLAIASACGFDLEMRPRPRSKTLTDEYNTVPIRPIGKSAVLRKSSQRRRG